MTWPNTRPSDLLFPEANRPGSIAEQVCVPAPFGCGGPAIIFTDALSQREYGISGLCQSCQDDFFGA